MGLPWVRMNGLPDPNGASDWPPAQPAETIRACRP